MTENFNNNSSETELESLEKNSQVNKCAIDDSIVAELNQRVESLANEPEDNDQNNSINNDLLAAEYRYYTYFYKNQFHYDINYQYILEDPKEARQDKKLINYNYTWKKLERPFRIDDIKKYLNIKPWEIKYGQKPKGTIFGAKPITKPDGENCFRNIVVSFDRPERTDDNFMKQYDSDDLYQVCNDCIGSKGLAILFDNDYKMQIYYPTDTPVEFYLLRRLQKALNLLVIGDVFTVYPNGQPLRLPLGPNSTPFNDRFKKVAHDHKVEYFLHNMKCELPLVNKNDLLNNIKKIYPGKYKTDGSGNFSENDLLSDHACIHTINGEYRCLQENGDKDIELTVDWIYDKIKNHLQYRHNLNYEAINHAYLIRDIHRVLYFNKYHDPNKKVAKKLFLEAQPGDRDYETVKLYYERNPISKRRLKEHNVTTKDAIKFLAFVRKLSREHDSDAVPIAFDFVRNQLKGCNLRVFKLCKKSHYIQKYKAHNRNQGRAATYKLMKALRVKDD